MTAVRRVALKGEIFTKLSGKLEVGPPIRPTRRLTVRHRRSAITTGDKGQQKAW